MSVFGKPSSACILKKGREKSILGRHPWIFSGAIDSVEKNAKPGDLVDVLNAERKWLGVGTYNPHSQIRIRMVSFDQPVVDEAFLESRLRQAAELRSRVLNQENTNAYRLVYGEGDFLPGLIVDRYNQFFVAQFLSYGMEVRKQVISEQLSRLFHPQGIYERSVSEIRTQEGLKPARGSLWGDEPPERIEIRENGIRFWVNVKEGQKTGFFLDQRENRMALKDFAAGKRVLNAFSYTGAFSVYALRYGAASVLSVDTSEQALELAKENFTLNDLPLEKGEFIKADVFDYLRQTDEKFDWIILDPPSFCRKRGEINRAARGYKDINLLGLKRLKPGGMLMTFSCSSYISPDLFQKIVFAAAKDARRDLQIIKRLSQAPDHPLNIFHPEGEYLKGFVCRAI